MELHTYNGVATENQNVSDIIVRCTIFTSPTKVMLTRKYNESLSVVNTITTKYRWPMRRNRLQVFSEDKRLDHFRKYSSSGVTHSIELTKKLI